jgi:hypothetical protein
MMNHSKLGGLTRIKLAGLLVVALFAWSGMAAASAMAAKEFESSKTGTATDEGTSTQVFHDEPKAAAVECKKLTSTEVITKTKTKTQAASVKYSECTAFGFPATISEAKYTFSSSGSVAVTNTITVEVPAAGCKVLVSPGGNNKLKTVTYTNKEAGTGHGKLEVSTKVSKISSEVKGGGGLCGKEGKLKTGTYTGSALVTLEGGEVKI